MRHTALPVDQHFLGEHKSLLSLEDHPIIHQHNMGGPIGASSPSVGWVGCSSAPCWVVSMEEGQVGVSEMRAGEMAVMAVLVATAGLVAMDKRGRAGGERE
jgi:hypothetical protein